MKWFCGIVLILMPVVAGAQVLPESLAAQVARDPDAYLDDLAVLISGYGKNGAIDGQGLQNFVAMERADARAMALRRLQGADLDGDGAILGDEMRIKAAASAAAARGRLILYFGKADLDRDDKVSANEVQAYANMVALQSISEEKAAKVYAVLGFDQDGDGWVTLAEAKALIGLSSSGPAKQKVKDQFHI